MPQGDVSPVGDIAMAGLTTIRITTHTRDDLKDLGFKDETYEEILRRLFKQARLLAVYECEKRILETEEFAPLH
jgi:hypothetical protein